LRQSLPINYFLLLQSFLLNRHFFVRFGSVQHPLSQILAGDPQGSVLGPFLYLIYTADLPTSPATTTATFADDTAILTSDSDPATAPLKLQNHLNAIQTWIPQVTHAGQSTQISSRYVHNTYRNVPSCPREQRAASLCGSSQIPWPPPGQKSHLAPPYLH
jgi:hypothetical protein